MRSFGALMLWCQGYGRVSVSVSVRVSVRVRILRESFSRREMKHGSALGVVRFGARISVS